MVDLPAVDEYYVDYGLFLLGFTLSGNVVDDVDVAIGDDDIDVSSLTGSSCRRWRCLLMMVVVLPVWLGIDDSLSMKALFYFAELRSVFSVVVPKGPAQLV